MLRPQDYEAWLEANAHRLDGKPGVEIIIMFANEAIESLRQLIADICTHADLQAHGRYASLKDEHDAVDQLNERILVALKGVDDADVTGTSAGEHPVI